MSVRTVLTATAAAAALLVLAGCSTSGTTATANSQASPSTSAGQDATWDVSGGNNQAGGVPAGSPSTPAASAPVDTSTVSEGDAVAKAEQYLNYTAFSRPGLIKQLQFDQFSAADATYAADHVTVDWDAEADKKASDYVGYTSFSHAGLIKQLQFDGFTAEQAAHGTASVGR